MSDSKKSSNDSITNNIIEIVKNSVLIFSGITGVVVALLWVLGRNYGRGYYNTIRIPLFQVSLSIWEYGELGWQLLLVGAYIAAIILVVEIGSRLPINPLPRFVKIIIWFVCSLSPLLFLRGDIHLNSKIYIYISLLFVYTLTLIRTVGEDSEENAKQGILQAHDHRFDRFLGWVLLIFLIVSFMLTTAYDVGTIDGRSFATGKSMKIRLILTKPLITDIPYNINNINTDSKIYIYDRLYLLLHNDKNYFVFQGLNQQCEPSHVYVIQDDQVQSVEYIDDKPLNPNCTP